MAVLAPPHAQHALSGIVSGQELPAVSPQLVAKLRPDLRARGHKRVCSDSREDAGTRYPLSDDFPHQPNLWYAFRPSNPL